MRALTMGAIAYAAPASAETLAQALADAYRNNPELQAQRAELRALDETVIEALAPYRLGATIDGNLNYNERRQRNVSSDEFSVFDQRNMGLSLTVTQLLISGGRTAAQASAAQVDVLAGRERLREIENSILFEVIDAYAAVRRDSQLVDIQGEAVGNYERQVRQNRSREAGGDLAMTDVAQADAQLLIIRAALAQARASLEQSRSRFAAVVGRNPGVLENEPPLPSLPVTSDEAQRIAAKESPLLWQAVLAERASGDRIAAARAERSPTLSTSASIGYVNPAGYQTSDLGRNVSAGLTFRMPLLSQGVIGSRVRVAIARQQSAAYRIEDARRTVAAGVLNAWNQVVTAQEQMRVGKEAVTAAERAVAGVRRSFLEGLRSNFEVIDSEQRLLNAQVLVVNARYSLVSGEASILAYAGRLQAVAMLAEVTPYDAAENLRLQKKAQFGPFVPIVHALDRLSRSPRQGRPAPAIPPFATPRLIENNAASPDGPLATGLPLLKAGPVDAAPWQNR